MFLKISALLLAYVAFVRCSEESALEEITERIVRGQPARQGQFPWMVALYLDGSFICTASLISRNIVLTAAHCVVDNNNRVRPAPNFQGHVGNVDRSAPEQILEFNTVYVHPEYGNLQKDIAFFTLRRPANLTANVRPICIARNDTGLDEYKDAVMMGWGSISNVPIYVNELMYTNATLLPHIKCRARYLTNTDDNHICADGFGRGICYGDSGGPLVHMSTGEPREIGVASFIRRFPGCGSIFIGPGVFTRCSSYTNWLLNTSGDNTICVR